ncbi:DUF6538 domain-containing protein [Lysobacter sp. TAF61]|uniref:DUF6538 domain-containing protein n=1 Tax=Lysobacter sp. TAF61 TaxID=3233072 RepID=UPI003F96E852
MPPSYLKKRGSTWYVQVPVPKHAQAVIGAKTLQRSLRTGCEKTAHRGRHSVIAEFHGQIASAGKPEPRWEAADLEAYARRLAAGISAGTVDRDQAEIDFDATFEGFLTRRGKALPKDAEGDPILPPAELSQVRRAHTILGGSEAALLDVAVSRWLELEGAKKITRGDLQDKTRYLSMLRDFVGSDARLVDVTRQKAVEFVDRVLTPWEVTRKTKLRALQVIEGFFIAAELRGQADTNPFTNVGRLVQDTTAGRKALNRRSWKPEEVHQLLQAIPPTDNAWPFVAIMAFTGMRNNEAAALRCEHVDRNRWSFTVVKSKSKAGTGRVVPVHPTLQPIVKRLLETSTNGWLVPGLEASGVDGKRSVTISKHVNRIKDDVHLSEDLDLYSFRRTVITQMKRAGVETLLRNQIVGHKGRQTVEEAHYLDPETLEVRRTALDHVTYGSKVEALLTERADDFMFVLPPKRRLKRHP